ncbi:MAG: tetratricopeptide repeat protein [bacterium]|nr:tetratricopeptide repeat protein [bacterium]
MEGNVKKNSIILLCFLASGMAGLIYEVVWARQLTLVFGNTTFAYSTILTVFMIGLAVGSKIFGKIADKTKNPIKLYGLIETAVGVYGLLFPYLIRPAENFSFLYTPESNFWVSGLVLFFFSFAILIVPTVLMGGTLPVISKYFVTNFQKRGEKIGKLYALNTFGAVLGSFLSGYLLVIKLGVAGSISFAATINLLVGLACLLISKKIKPVTPPAEETVAAPPKPPAASKPGMPVRDKIVITCFLLSGLTSMVYEVTWSRILTLLLGSSVYAFAAMLTTFLLGLALGSYLFSIIYRNKTVNYALFGRFEIRIGILCLLTIPLFNQMGYWSYVLHATFSQSDVTLQVFNFLLVFLVMILPTLLLGATFPLVSQLLIRNYKHLGKEIGTVYFWNTMGSTLGAFLAGFLFIPLIGIKNSIVLAVIINILAGNTLLFLGKMNRKKIVMTAISVILLFAVFSTPFNLNMDMLTHGLYLPVGKEIPSRQEFLRIAKASKLLYYKEGLSAIVSVHKTRRNTFLRINGKVDASSNLVDMSTQLLLGHMPFFFSLKPSYEHVAVIGMGSGVTAAAAVKHPVKTVYMVEIEEAVVEAGKYFKDVNENVLENKRVKTVIADGRHFVHNFDGTFDIIISEPSNPWMAGIGNLFSGEFYKIAFQKLGTDGVFCQWLHGYRMSPRLFKVILKTFHKVFDQSYLWFTGEGDYLLIGKKSGENQKIDFTRLLNYFEKNPGIVRDLKKVSVPTPYALSALFLLDGPGLHRLTLQAETNTDDFPLLEFLAPRDLYSSTEELTFNGLYGLKESGAEIFTNVPNADDNKIKARRYLSCARVFQFRALPGKVIEYCRKALACDPEVPAAHHLLAVTYLNRGAFLRAEDTLLRSIGVKDNAKSHGLLAELYLKRELSEKALEHLQIALEMEPAGVPVLKKLGSVYFGRRDYNEALKWYEQALQLKPSDLEAVIKKAQIYSGLNQYNKAIEILTGIPKGKRTLLMFRLLGDYYGAAGNLDNSLHYCLEAFKADPYSIDNLTSLGICYYRRGELEPAAEVFDIILRTQPYNPTAISYRGKIN